MSVKVIARRHANLCFICFFCFFLFEGKDGRDGRDGVGAKVSDDSNSAIIFSHLFHIDSPENYCKFIKAKSIV